MYLNWIMQFDRTKRYLRVKFCNINQKSNLAKKAQQELYEAVLRYILYLDIDRTLFFFTVHTTGCSLKVIHHEHLYIHIYMVGKRHRQDSCHGGITAKQF